MMERFAHAVIARRHLILGTWVVLTFFGAFSAIRVSDRWLEQFSIPGYSAYEANQRTLKAFGTGEFPPLVAVFRSDGDVTKVPGIATAISRAAALNPGSRVSSYFSTGNDMYVSRDRHVTFANIYPAGNQGFQPLGTIGKTRAALKEATPAGVSANLTGRDPLYDSEGGAEGPSVLTEAMIGGTGALIILLFVFGTLPAVAMPLLVALTSILTTFSLVWALTYVTSVSIIVQFLVALIGLGVAIDYSLLMIFRFREELALGEDRETALVETMKHAGRSVIVSGSTVAVGLLSMVILPVPVIRSIGIGGMLIPAVSVLASITFVPALLYVLGHRINSLRVLPRRLVRPPGAESGLWHRWAQVVLRRPVVVALVGLAIVAALLIPGVQLNPAEAKIKDFPAQGDSAAGRRTLAEAGITAGVYKPLIVLAEGLPRSSVPGVRERLSRTPGIVGAAAPPAWYRQIGGVSLFEAFAADDGAAKSVRKTISHLQNDVLPGLENSVNEAGSSRVNLTLGGVAPEERDFVHAVYGKFPYVLAFVILLTFVLLMRAFRSVLLPLKAVILNLVSLGAAFGIIVFIFQMGHGSQAIWNVPSTDSIISWIPLMIFAFLYGLSMDYEVFMLTRMREAYDETNDSRRAVALGLARTGKLVTSAALVLMFAFFVLSTSPGTDIKQFGIGLAAGIIFDATVIRALLVPAIMRLMGRWNWWLPAPAAKVLFTRPSYPKPEPVREPA